MSHGLLRQARIALDDGEFALADSLALSILRRDLSNLEGLKIRTLALEALGKLSSAATASSQAGVISGDGAYYVRAAEFYLRLDQLEEAAWSLREAAGLYQEAGLPDKARAAEARASCLGDGYH
ncbi:MAG: hypothetical protein KC910_33370 [Candidatus Eremiobacteraeota bacterium]|nr:hypothetical protein [Candidatus Eremiobacteraeota bacterium]